MKRQVASALIGCLMLACDHRVHRARKIIYMVDVTASLTPGTPAVTIDALRRLIPALNRGDELVVVPVTDDARTESLGKILRLRISLQREPYDADLRRASNDAADGLQQLVTAAMAHRYQRTDLLGAFSLAAEELDRRSGTRAPLVCVSDFIQDDQQFDFKRDTNMAQPASAKHLAARLAQSYGSRFRGVTIFLGSLPSLDTRGLGPARRDAVRDFWIEFLQAQGALVRWKTDGIGHVVDFLNQTSHDIAPVGE